ncbi:hypothetical protein QBE53_11625 [Vallitaleaceae bacterium 9-2]
MGVFLCRHNPAGSDLVYPEQIEEQQAKRWHYLGDYLFDTQRSDYGFNAYWQAYLHKDEEALINMGILLLRYGFEQEGQQCIIHGYKNNQSPKVLYVYIKCMLVFGWEDTINIDQYIVKIAHHPDEDAFDFLVWYYQFMGETEHSITAFLQLKDEKNQLKWLRYYLAYMIGIGKDIYAEVMIKHLKEKYPEVYTKALLGAHLDCSSYAFVIEYTDNNSDYALYQSLAYYSMNQIISSVEAANRILLEQLSDQERVLAYYHMAKLAEVGSDFQRETHYLEALVHEWKQRERYIKKEIQAYAIRFYTLDKQ